MKERDFQRDARKVLKDGKSVLVIAPTGLGKTRAVLSPYVEARNNKHALLGRRLIYSLPLRALTQGVKEELETLLSNNGIHSRVAVHHGEEPESKIFSESACITTVDQYFTAFAGAPLSFAMNSGHAVAGAILTSYSVFDEVHLLSPQKGLPLLFAILKLRQRWGLLSAVMTATLPKSVVEYFKKNLGIEIVSASKADIEERDGWRKVKVEYKGVVENKDLVELIQEKFQACKKVIVFINTVERAINLYREFKKETALKDELILIHSRFDSEHRKNKEEKIMKNFGKNSDWEGIVITTQVCEAGMNISAPVVISELAPADSLIQRAGRCVRFEKGEHEGEFIVIKPEGDRYFTPYPKDIVETTEKWLENNQGKNLDWELEQKLINDSLDAYYSFYVRGERLPKESKEPEEETNGEEEQQEQEDE